MTFGFLIPKNTVGAKWNSEILMFGLREPFLYSSSESIIPRSNANFLDRPRSGFSFLPSADGILLHGTSSSISFSSTIKEQLGTGGYCKEYTKGKRPIGVMLDDTWFLKYTPSSSRPYFLIPNHYINSLSTPTPTAETSQKSKSKQVPLQAKWARRKRPSYLPSLRSGCTMTLWATKGVGVLFGGVTDEDTSEERMESVFWNDL